MAHILPEEQTTALIEANEALARRVAALEDAFAMMTFPLQHAPLPPPVLLPYEPDLDAIRWMEDCRHGPSRPRRLTCWLIFWRACPHQRDES